MKIDGKHFEDMRTFGGLVVSSQNGTDVMLQTTDYGAVCGRPVAFDKEMTRKLRDFLSHVLGDTNDE